MIDCYPPIPVEVTAGAYVSPAGAGAGPLGRYVTQFVYASASTEDVMLQGSYATPSSAQGLSAARSSAGTTKLPTGVLEAREGPATDDADAEAALMARRRATLIAVRNATAAPSVELLARLDILNARMRAQSPRVTEEHLQTLEASTALLERIAARRTERLARRAAGA